VLTISGKIPSLTDSMDLITSTIVYDFDKNPNVGYTLNSSSSQTLSTSCAYPAQPSLPNPFVRMDLINQKITNEIQDGITAAASFTSHTEKHIEIKCISGMILSDYKCS
jgi:hypothetical protein